MSLGRRATAECIGTFWLVFGGCGSAVLSAAFPNFGIGFVGVALAFGLTVLSRRRPLRRPWRFAIQSPAMPPNPLAAAPSA